MGLNWFLQMTILLKYLVIRIISTTVISISSIAEKELDDIEGSLQSILSNSVILSEFLARKRIRYNLLFYDGGKCSFLVCSK